MWFVERSVHGGGGTILREGYLLVSRKERTPEVDVGSEVVVDGCGRTHQRQVNKVEVISQTDLSFILRSVFVTSRFFVNID